MKGAALSDDLRVIVRARSRNFSFRGINPTLVVNLTLSVGNVLVYKQII